MTVAPPSRRRSGGTLGDMVRTTVVLGLVVLAIVFVAKDRKDNTAVKRVDGDVALLVRQVAPGASFAVLAPTGLPQAWAPTSTSYDVVGGHRVFHVGYVTPAGRFADLEESDAPVTAALAPYAGGDLSAQGSVPIAGRATAIATAGNGRLTLTQTVTVNGKTTYLGVTGGADQPELTTLLESLRPV